MSTIDPKYKIIIPLPIEGFDPSEVAVTWKILKEEGVQVHFATPNAKLAKADPIVLTGKGLGPLKYNLRADKIARQAYAFLGKDPHFNKPLSYEQIDSETYEAVVLPGGHAKGMRPYLESKLLQNLIVDFAKNKKIVASICHGVILVARSIDPETGKSVLFGKKTTALPKFMEKSAWLMTCLWMGDYYRTYPKYVEDEVIKAIGNKSFFLTGPKSLKRDGPKNLHLGFCVEDENFISSRWPGDVHLFAKKILHRLKA